MSDWELLEKIKEWVGPEDNEVLRKVISDNIFIKDPRNSEFFALFKETSYFARKFEWHQVARFALQKADSQRFMYDKLWNLLEKYQDNYDIYFELETELGTFTEPNPLTKLNRLVTLYKEFFEIYTNITNRIHFDFPKREFAGPSLRGKINWKKTLRKSNTEFPINFISDIPFKKFDTPGNILLILCVLWMHRECTRILQLDFPEPLDNNQKEILKTISEKTTNILQNFPFAKIVEASVPYWTLQNNDKKILSLENQSRKRIEQGLVRNKNYKKLLDWIKQFRNLNLMMVSESTPTTNLLKTQVAQDTIYEAWIFFEFIDFFKENGMLVELNLHRDSKPYYFKFEYSGKIVTWYYEREFKPTGEYAWVLQQKPDFTIMVDEKIIAIYDAKNYSEHQKPNQGMNKMLAYMTNFNTKLGILFFPYLPKFWDDYTDKERRKLLLPQYIKDNPNLTKEQVESMQKPEATQYWNDLPRKYQKIAPRNSVKPFLNPEDSEMTLYQMRMEPSNKPNALEMKDQTIETIFDEIKQELDKRKNEPAMELAT